MANWYYVREGRREGPVSAEFIADEFRRGRMTRDDVVWTEGFEQWRPVSELPDLLELAERTPPPLPAEMAEAAAAAMAARFGTPPTPNYAPFPRRVLAMLIDSAVLMVPGLIVLVIVASIIYATNENFDLEKPEDAEHLQLIFNFCALPILWLYYAGFESSSMQATPGKYYMGLRVADMQGQRISFLRATLRFFCKNFTLPVGFPLALLTERHQALHDLVAKTLVIEGK